jgi:hypothetical protein
MRWYVLVVMCVSVAVHMKGQLSIPALSSALNALVARHEILRTSFDTCDGELRQVIGPGGLEAKLESRDARAGCPCGPP